MYNGNGNIRFISCKIGNVRNENCQKYTKDYKDCTQASRFIARFEFIKYLKTLSNRMEVYLLLCCLICSIHIGYYVHDAHRTILGKREKLENSLCNGFVEMVWKTFCTLCSNIICFSYVQKSSLFIDLSLPLLSFPFLPFPFCYVVGRKKTFHSMFNMLVYFELYLVYLHEGLCSSVFSTKEAELLIFCRQPI